MYLLTIFISSHRRDSHLNHALKEIYKRFIRNNNIIRNVSIITKYKIKIIKYGYYLGGHKVILRNIAITFTEKITR